MNNSSGKQMKDPSLVENFDGTAQNANIGGYAGGFGTSAVSSLMTQITSVMSTINANFFTKGFSQNIATNIFLGYWPNSAPPVAANSLYNYYLYTMLTTPVTTNNFAFYTPNVIYTAPTGTNILPPANVITGSTALPSTSGLNVLVTTTILNASGNPTSTPTAFTGVPISSATIRDVNSLWFYSSNTSLFNFVQGLYAWHNLLIPTNWANFIQGNPTKIYVPDIPTSNGANASSLFMNTNITLTLNTNNNTYIC